MNPVLKNHPSARLIHLEYQSENSSKNIL